MDNKELKLGLSEALIEKILEASIKKSLTNNKELREQLIQNLEIPNIGDLIEIELPKTWSEESDDLTKVKTELKVVLIKNTQKSLETLKDMLIESSPTYNQIILLLSRFSRNERFLKQRVISYDTACEEFNRIDDNAIYIIDDIRDDEIKKKTG